MFTFARVSVNQWWESADFHYCTCRRELRKPNLLYLGGKFKSYLKVRTLIIQSTFSISHGYAKIVSQSMTKNNDQQSWQYEIQVAYVLVILLLMWVHCSEKRGFCFMKCSSKTLFATFLEYENPCIFFCFSFCATLFF